MPDDEQLLSWYDDVSARPLPRGTSSFGVDRDAGVLRLVLSPDHDDVAVHALLDGLPPDVLVVEVANARWHACGTGPDLGLE